MRPSSAASPEVTVLQPVTGWRPIDWRELWRYRDLFRFMVWRDIKTRYAQSVLGIGWAVIQPVFSMIVFTIIFGRLAQIDSDGQPYAIFNFSGMVPWTYFSVALSTASGSLTASSSLINKVYFPRLIVPLAPLVGKLVDFFISLALLGVLMVYFGITPRVSMLLLPLPVLVMMLTAGGMSMWITALSVQYRDVRYAMSFFIQLLMYSAPIVYSISYIPEKFLPFYALNPMVGVIESFRAVLFGDRPMPWAYLGLGTITALALALSGALYFQRLETRFADVA